MKLQNNQIPTAVILVEPSGPLNIGSVARLCANYGVTELRLVSPRCDPYHPDAIRMAVKGNIYLKRAKKFSSLIDAISDCQKVIATCGRLEKGEIPLHSSNEILNWLSDKSNKGPIGLIFGREDRGLSNEELLLANKVLTLSSEPTYPSLNLSHAVAIVLHELKSFQDKDLKSISLKENNATNELAFPIQVEDCLKDAEVLLLEVGFLLEHTAKSRMQKIRGLLKRAEVKSNEVALIRGMIRQFRWAIHSKHS